ncbi:MAG: alpha/beta fold hydrolase [Nocardiopsis sp. BM-2018]|nr:MAG: alpha/beta fold hydrolase [Nocardiopsis sp. BM-2018]
MPRARTTIRTASVATATGLALSLTAVLPAAAGPAGEASPGYPVNQAALAPFSDQELVWAPCTEQELAAEGLALECADFEVPLDYAEPDGDRLTIAVSRAAATEPEERLGVLLLNPGGPGVPARVMPRDQAGTPLHEVYDLIGMDPRGTGASSRLDCGAELPDIVSRPTDAEISAHTRATIRYTRACDAAEGHRFPHMTSANTARDMEVLRTAMGEEQINYLGYSYGTYLGAVYGSLFPERLNRSVLDSAVHPDEIWRDLFMGQGPAGTANLERYTAWLTEHDDVFGFGSSHEEIVALFDETSARYREEPLEEPFPGFGPVDGARFDSLVFWYARNQGHWDMSSWVLQVLVTGEPVPEAAALPDGEATAEENQESPAEPDPWEEDPAFAMGTDLFSAIVCEAEWPDRISQYHAQARAYGDDHPYSSGALWAAPQACTFTRNPPTEPAVELARDGYPEALVIAADLDANTHYAGGPALAERLDSPLLTVVDEGGHRFAFMPDQFTGELGYPCVNEVVAAYLIDGEVPGDKECTGIPRSAEPLTPHADNAPTALAPEVTDPLEQVFAGPLGSGNRAGP